MSATSGAVKRRRFLDDVEALLVRDTVAMIQRGLVLGVSPGCVISDQKDRLCELVESAVERAGKIAYVRWREEPR